MADGKSEKRENKAVGTDKKSREDNGAVVTDVEKSFAEEQDKNVRIKKSDVIAKIMCVFAAFCLWIYVMAVESPAYEQTFSYVTVELVNTDELVSDKGLMLYSGYGNMIGVTLSGKKSVISKLTDSDIVVTADVSRITGSSGRYDVKINVDVPAGCKLVGTSQDTISVYLDEASHITVDLTEQRENTALPEGCFMGAIEYPVDKITVEGPDRIVSRVSGAVADIDLSGVTSSTKIRAGVYLIDEDGKKVESPYLKFYPTELNLDISILKTVEVPVEVYFKNGFLNFENTDTVVDPQIIKVTGDPEVIDAGGLLEPVEIDEKTEFSVPGLMLSKKVQLKAKAGVELSSDTVEITSSVNPTLKLRRLTVQGANIKDRGAKNGVEYTWDRSPVEIAVIGSLEAISSLTSDDITLVLDMSPYSKTNTGSVEVIASVEIDSEHKDDLFVLGVYEITVTFENQN